jgi:hypothetical protein
MQFRSNRWLFRAGLWASLLAGFGASVFVAFSFGRNSSRDMNIVETHPEFAIPPEFRGEVDQFFGDYLSKKWRDHIQVNVVDGMTFDVEIVATYSGAEYGFVTTSRKLGPIFFISGEGFRIYRYNDRNLFFMISDWYARERRIQAWETKMETDKKKRQGE